MEGRILQMRKRVTEGGWIWRHASSCFEIKSFRGLLKAYWFRIFLSFAHCLFDFWCSVVIFSDLEWLVAVKILLGLPRPGSSPSKAMASDHLRSAAWKVTILNWLILNDMHMYERFYSSLWGFRAIISSLFWKFVGGALASWWCFFALEVSCGPINLLSILVLFCLVRAFPWLSSRWLRLGWHSSVFPYVLQWSPARWRVPLPGNEAIFSSCTSREHC